MHRIKYHQLSSMSPPPFFFLEKVGGGFRHNVGETAVPEASSGHYMYSYQITTTSIRPELEMTFLLLQPQVQPSASVI